MFLCHICVKVPLLFAPALTKQSQESRVMRNESLTMSQYISQDKVQKSPMAPRGELQLPLSQFRVCFAVLLFFVIF